MLPCDVHALGIPIVCSHIIAHMVQTCGLLPVEAMGKLGHLINNPHSGCGISLLS